ncbi:tape measure protein [Spirosoma oryzicola]|uniref:tape measure protein n=1 Tax=Spirosoma oryzicola TaxID=2898794 RepID=UPI001E3B2996|nr:tape measure protein [Spirosoma oryzicola]UHG91756.1 tape measure protein [Spirosoma oryzicola]
MSAREQNIRFNFKVASEFPQVISQLETVNDLIEKQSKVASASADAVKTSLLQQRNDTKATADESLAIAKEIARQTTLERKAQLDQQTAQLKASEAQNTAFVKASEQERAAITKQIAQQTTNEQNAELRRREIELQASTERQTAAYRASLIEQAQAAQRLNDQTTLELKAELNERTIAVKAEADQQTAAIRAEQQRQTMILRNELAEQRAELKQQGNAYSELRNFIASAFGVYEIIEFGRGVIDAKSKIDVFRTGLQQMIGSKREADELFARLLEMAKTTPFQVENLMETAFQLKAMGTATKDLIPTLEVLGNMAAVVGEQKLGLIAKAFNDVQNKGKLMKQELNQFAENGVPLYDLLAESMGKTRDEVVKLAEDHKISFAQVKEALFDASSAGGRYYNLMSIQAQTLGGQVSNLADKFFLAKAKLGDYFENGLQKVVSGLSSLVEWLAGSDKAIDRNVKIVEAAGAAWLTYHGYVNSAMIAERAMAAAITAKNVVVGAGSLAMGTLNLLMISATGYTDLFSAAQVRSAAAARATWAAFLSNPLGAIILTVGALTTAYLAWQAANVIVIESIGEQQAQLEKEQRSLKVSIEQAMNLKEGTKERAAAIQSLINKYPDYFAGLDAEHTNNAQLKKILDKVNESYTTRIALAKEAYRTELNEGKLKSLIEQQEQLMKVAAQRLPAEVMLKVGGDASQLLKVIQEVPKYAEMLKGDWMTQVGDDVGRLFGGINPTIALKQITAGLKEYETEVKASDERIKKIKADNNTALITLENERHKTVLAQLKAANDGSAKDQAEYNRKAQAEEKLHATNLGEVKQQARKKEEQAENEHGGKMKTITANTAAQIKVEKLRYDSDSYFEKVKLLKAEEDAQIESVNRVLVNSKASGDKLAAVRAQSMDKIKEIHAATEKKIQDLRDETVQTLLSDTQDIVETDRQAQEAIVAANQKSKKEIDKENKEAKKEQIKDAKEIAKEVQDAEAETQKIQAETHKIQTRAYKEQTNLLFSLLGQQGGIITEMSGTVKKVYDDWDMISGKSKAEAASRLQSAETEYARYMNMYLQGDKEAEGMAARMKVTKAQATQDMTEISAAQATTALGLVGMLVSVAQKLFAALNEMHAETFRAISKAIGVTIEATNAAYDKLIEIEKENYSEQLQFTKGSYDERIRVIEQFYDRQKELVSNRDFMNDMLASNKAYADAILEAGRDTVWNHKNYTETMARAEIEINADKAQRIIQMEINQIELQKEKAAEIRDAKIDALDEYNDRFKQTVDETIDKLNEVADAEIDAINRASDKKKSALEEQLSEVKSTYDENVRLANEFFDNELKLLRAQESAKKAELQATFDLRQQLLEQSTLDEIEKIGIIDRARNEALERYRIDEVARLTATRDRILATLTDEGERERVTNEYAQRIGQVHKDVEDAKLDKTKGVSLATTQLRNEEKDTAERLKQEEKTALAILEQNFQTLFEQLSDQKDARLEKLKADSETRETELKAQIKKIEEDSKTAIEAIQNELKAKTVSLQNQVAQNEAEAALKKKIANAEYTNAVIGMNRQLFEANKAMKIAEIQTEIAILNAQKSWTGIGNGKINEAIGQLQQAISSIQGLSAGGQEVAVDGGHSFDPGNGTYHFNLDQGELQYIVDMNKAGGRDKISLRDGAVTGPSSPVREDNLSLLPEGQEVGLYKDGNPITLRYAPDGHRIFVNDANGKPVIVAFAYGYVPKTGEQFAQGTEYVEGRGYPDGIDTVPSWLTKGERVIDASKNKSLNGISNEELVARSTFFEKLQLSLPDLRGTWADIGSAKLRLPNGILSSDGKQMLDFAELTGEMQKTRQAIENQKLLRVSIDRQGFAESEIGKQSITNYWGNILDR